MACDMIARPVPPVAPVTNNRRPLPFTDEDDADADDEEEEGTVVAAGTADAAVVSVAVGVVGDDDGDAAITDDGVVIANKLANITSPVVVLTARFDIDDVAAAAADDRHDVDDDAMLRWATRTAGIMGIALAIIDGTDNDGNGLANERVIREAIARIV